MITTSYFVTLLGPDYGAIAAELEAALTSLTWADAQQTHRVAVRSLRTIATNQALLRRLLECARIDPSLRSLCEHYDILDKLVLADHPTGARLRLHLFHAGVFDRPHNHRWSYASLILKGAYEHLIFGSEDILDLNLPPSQLSPVLVRTEHEGSAYFLNHSMVHSVRAEPQTISLILRGPAVKESFVVTDRVTDRMWVQHGRVQESEEERQAKALSDDQFEVCLGVLRQTGVIA